jgi:hypothetical protein
MTGTPDIQAEAPASFFTDPALRKEIPAPASAHLRAMSDEEIEEHVRSCGVLMLQAYARWEQSGCFGDRGEADRWRALMRDGVAARRPQRVARMEAERGLCRA